jgi:predicted HTH domain antitoxin
LLKGLRDYMEAAGLDRSAAIRRLLERGIKDWKLELALNEYREGKISLMKASEKAEITVWEFLDELDKRKIPLNISMEAVEKSLGL